jgi:hypothetical protein
MSLLHYCSQPPSPHLSSAMSPSDVIIRDVNLLPAALVVVKTVFAPKRWHFYVPTSVLTSTAQSG